MSMYPVGQFPSCRPRRLRQSPALRQLVRETQLHPAQLVLPLFARSGRKLRRPIAAMPGVFQLSPDELLREAARAHELGVPAVLLFGIPEAKDAVGSDAYSDTGIIQQTIRALKKEVTRESGEPPTFYERSPELASVPPVASGAVAVAA